MSELHGMHSYRTRLRVSELGDAPAMACMTADADAVAMARKCGYAVMRPDGRQIRVDTKYLRCIPSEK